MDDKNTGFATAKAAAYDSISCFDIKNMIYSRTDPDFIFNRYPNLTPIIDKKRREYDSFLKSLANIKDKERVSQLETVINNSMDKLNNIREQENAYVAAKNYYNYLFGSLKPEVINKVKRYQVKQNKPDKQLSFKERIFKTFFGKEYYVIVEKYLSPEKTELQEEDTPPIIQGLYKNFHEWQARAKDYSDSFKEIKKHKIKLANLYLKTFDVDSTDYLMSEQIKDLVSIPKPKTLLNAEYLVNNADNIRNCFESFIGRD